jgi:superfamily II DNA or RNA helicase/HKD family nuclease
MAHDPPKNPRSSETPESSDSKGLMQTTPDPNLPAGLYEHLITELLQQRLEALPPDHFYIQQQPVDPAEAARYLTGHLSQLIRFALNEVPTSQRPLAQIELANKIIRLIAREIDMVDLQHDLLATQGHLLEAIINRIDQPHADLSARVREIMPHTRLSQSELFTGNRAGVSLESEIKKEIASADEICWLVSFIKFSGIRTLLPTLREFTQHRRFRIITTSYMGATDLKAIRELAALPNTEIKVSYDALHERLHAKAYLFLRNSGFHTGYIGSSNLSRSALTSGLEWNMKVTTREVAHIIDKFRKTFDTYWEDGDFERFDPQRDTDRLRQALQSQRNSTLRGAGTTDDPDAPISVFFELTPKPFQREILERFHTERTLHGRRRNLLVAATGTGKTVISAFDFKRYRKANPSARLLFIAHRKEILQQARHTFRHVLRDANFGELWVDGHTPDRLEVLFASVQTFNSQIDRLAALGADYYDFIIIDEVHHLTASSYRTVLQRFTPDVLLGLTATPERMDGGDITEDFDGRIAAEIRLPEALNRKLLCPFQYFGVTDQTDLRQVNWRNGKYDTGELTRIFTGHHIAARQRVQSILDALERYCTDPATVRTLGFCVTKEHARYMAETFQQSGYQADVLLGDTPRDEREAMRSRLREGKLNYLFVVDVFNEGVDIPEVDTVLFLRPTESLTVFLQQLGRGLRLSEGKDILTVLDFVGNARPEYDFEHKFRALIGRTRQSVQKEIEHDFPHLPLGCSIVLERQARDVILENIRRATSLNRRKMVQRIQQFRHQSTKPLSWSNFLTFHHLEPAAIYRYKTVGKYIGWNRLCAEAGVGPDFTEPQESELSRYIATRLLTTQSESYFRFVLALMDAGCDIDVLRQREEGLSEGGGNSQYVNYDPKTSQIVNIDGQSSQNVNANPENSHSVNADDKTSQIVNINDPSSQIVNDNSENSHSVNTDDRTSQFVNINPENSHPVNIDDGTSQIVNGNSGNSHSVKVDDETSQNVNSNDLSSQIVNSNSGNSHSVNNDDKTSQIVNTNSENSHSVNIDGETSQIVNTNPENSHSVNMDGKTSQNVNSNDQSSQIVNANPENSHSVNMDGKTSQNVNINDQSSQVVNASPNNSQSVNSYLSTSQYVNNKPHNTKINALALSLHYDIFQSDGPSSGAANLRESLLRLQSNPVMLSEIREVTEHLLNELDIIEKPLESDPDFPLHIHGRYNRDQILVAMRLHTWERASSNREGVANNNDINAESLFITLNKSEEDYSPSTLYEDYALNEQLFHWQSQNASVPERGRGLSYVEHQQNGKEILMFVREQNKDHNGLTMSYVFLGPCEYVDHKEARPMNIQWSLAEPIPAYLLNESRKLAVG